MNIRRRSARLIRAFLALVLLAVFGPAKGVGFDLNHYILGCSDACPYFRGPVVIGGGDIDASFTGSWYDPAQSGHGLFLEVLPNQRMAAFWFTFSPDGTRQAWLAGIGTYAGDVASIDSVTMPAAGRWIPNFDATKVVDNPWGTMMLTFDDASNGKVKFTSLAGFGTGSMKLARLTSPARNAAMLATSSGQLVPTGGLVEPRDSPKLVTLANGNVLAVGGGNEGLALSMWSNTRGVELYDPTTRTWVMSSAMSGPRRDHSATVLQDGQVLVVGGMGTVYEMPHTSERYDPSTRVWTTEPGPDRIDHAAILLNNGKVLIVGGYSYTTSALSPTLYDPATHTWGEAGSVSIEREVGHRATLLADGRVVVTGGAAMSMADGDSIATETYDPVTNGWHRTGDLHFPRYGHTATLLSNGKVLVAGGTGAVLETELYDPTSGQWTVTGRLRAGRFNHTASRLPNGKVLITGGIIGGVRDGHLGDSTEIYDPATGLWTESTPLLTARALHSATFLANGDVLLVGGYGPQQDRQGNNMLLGTSEIYSAAFPAGTIVPGYSGAWYDPAQKGHGILVEVLPNAQMLAWWFAFNPAGTEQAWFGGLGSYSGNTATISAVDQPTAGRFIPNFDASKIVHSPWGSLTLTFMDCDHGKVDFASTAGYGSGRMNLTRLTRPAGLVCP